MKMRKCFFFLALSMKVYAVDDSESKLIEMCIKNATIVFDVGAHGGEWTDICLKHNANAKFFLFEPSSFLSQQLIQKFSEQKNISVFQLGLSNTDGSVRLYNPGSPLGGYYFRPGCHNPDNTELVPVMTIDSFAETYGIDHVDLLKIDTEGAELDILHGSSKLLASHCIDVIQFEYGGTYLDANITLETVYRFLLSFGYKFMRIEAPKMIPIDTWHPSLENYHYSNYCAYIPGKTRVSD
jgi:FkbM family methyltransferase